MSDTAFIPQDHQVLRDTKLINPAKLVISTKDSLVLRELASRYVEFANLPKEAEKRSLQRKKNNLEWVRPLVICFPETSWREIVTKDSLQCQGELARSWENRLRQLLFTAEMNSDECLPQEFELGYVHEGLNWGIHQEQIGDLEHGSYRWNAPIQQEDDLALVKAPTMKVDFAASERMLELADDCFGDLLAVRRKESWYWTNGLTQTFIYLRGLEQMMYDMLDRPALVHGLMQKLSDGTMAFLRELERDGFLSPNWDISYCGSGGIGLTDVLPQDDFNGNVRLKDLWGFAESQETVGVSPRMFAQFILPYQRPLMDLFGYTYYGCCEPVDQRWRYLKEIPNLRRLSVSPWSDRVKMAEYLGRDYIYCLKPNPATLAWDTMPEDEVRVYARETLDIAGDCHLEFILKDVTTVRNQPERIHRWVAIVKEEIFKRYS